jgi:diguanylate cyclase (GGDEF)-like protein
MKRLISALAVILGLFSALSAVAEPGPIASLAAVRALSHSEAAKEPAVAFEATVTYRRDNETTLFVQDGKDAIWVYADTKFKLKPGDRVLVHGKAQDSFRTIVISDSVTALRHGEMPKPVPVTYDQLIGSQFDCMRVSVMAKVLSADVIMSSDMPTTHMRLLVDGSLLEAYVNFSDPNVAQSVLDATIELTGVAGAAFDGKMHQTGVTLSVPVLADLKVIENAGTRPWSLPLTDMNQINTNYRLKYESRRVRIHGTITYYQPGSTVILQNGTTSLWVQTIREAPLRIGDQADATGIPDVRDGYLTLSGGEIMESPPYVPIFPQSSTVTKLASGRQIFDLVSVTAQVVMEVRESSQDEYILVANGQVFAAIYHHPNVAGLQALPMNRVSLGSTVRVNGICFPSDHSNPFNHDQAFNILMRTPDDISVIAGPSFLSVANLIILVVLLLIGMMAVGSRGWYVEGKVRRQTVAVAYTEKRRSRILEKINGSQPLAEVIEEITELVSYKLSGAPSWCQIAGGTQLGNCPPKIAAFRLIQAEIPGRSGQQLGFLFAALDPLAKSSVIESETLTLATSLAALAIETRRLYSDLRHRSDFDLLTDTLNRFSLDKRLDDLLANATESRGMIGLIYVDLDRFKQINDSHGHQLGDLYLKEVAFRMKSQIRAVDALARLGGDEFAVLVPDVRSRADVEEIALRLEHCFDEPFFLEEVILHTSASVGRAIYPDDAANKELLFRAADTAMYAAKNLKRRNEGSLAGAREPEPAQKPAHKKSARLAPGTLITDH